MDAYIQYLEKYDTSFKVISGLFSLIIIWGYFYFKSNSLYSIIDKLWSLFVGSKGFTNESINSFHKDRHDLDKFNAIYNLKATNTLQIEKFILWTKREKYDTKKISSIKGWFDISKLEPIRPPVWESLFLGVSFPFLCIVTALFLFIGSTQNAVVKLDDNDSWFLMDHNRAKTVFSKLIISKANCHNEKYPREKYSLKSGITPNSVDSICAAFEKQSEMDAVDEIIRKQTALLFFSIIPLFFMIHNIKNLSRRINAYNFYKQYQKDRNR